MTFPKTIHVDLTPLQSTLLEKMRRHLPHFTEAELQEQIVSKGFTALDAEAPVEDLIEDYGSPAGESERQPRHVGDSITIALNEKLRGRLENLLRARPAVEEQEAFSSLLDLALTTLVELRIVRKRDIL